MAFALLKEVSEPSTAGSVAAKDSGSIGVLMPGKGTREKGVRRWEEDCRAGPNR